MQTTVPVPVPVLVLLLVLMLVWLPLAQIPTASTVLWLAHASTNRHDTRATHA